MWKVSRPEGVVVSIPSVSAESRSGAARAAIVSTRCLSVRPSRSRRQTTRCPIRRAGIRGIALAWGARADPEAVSEEGLLAAEVRVRAQHALAPHRTR